MNFDTAFEALIGHEGGFVDHPNDPGGATKYGISKRSYPNEDIPNLTLARAKEIYRRDFWNAVKGDQLPYPVAFEVFDAAVNHGVGAAVRLLQKACGVSADGILGPVSLATAQAMDPLKFKCRFNGARLQFYTDLPNWQSFGKGWARRVANNLKDA
jgi:lysozyme family protein